jgi:hypothetical protein
VREKVAEGRMRVVPHSRSLRSRSLSRKRERAL